MSAAAFLRTILAHPDDDGPRLVFANWLDEHGQPERAEFIRVQIDLARCPFTAPDYDRLAERERQLLDEWRAVWWSELPQPTGWSWGAFHRGFVSSVTLWPDKMPLAVANLPLLRASAPLRRLEVNLSTRGAGANLLEHCPLDWVRELAVKHPFPLERLWSWLTSPAARQLERFDLEMDCFNDTDLEQFLAAPRLDCLHTLDLARAIIDADTAQQLAVAASLQHLRELRLGGALEDANLHALATSPYLNSLETLRIRWGHFTSAGLTALANSPLLGRLTTLDLSCSTLEPAGVSALARSPQMRRVVRLDLNECELPAATLTELAESPHLAQVRRLNVAVDDLDHSADAVAEVVPQKRPQANP
jgi:uncharacterized protein (TIGR02996 family)